jgi:CRISPR-associated protein Csb2
MLQERFGEEPRQRHAEVIERIEDLKTSRQRIAGKGAEERKAKIDAQIATTKSELSSIVTRPPVRPTIGLWTGYSRAQADPVGVAHSLFDQDILILTIVGGPTLPVTSTLAVMRSLRDTIMSQSGVQPVPDWVSGHHAEGQPLRNEDGHLALMPLPFVGRKRSDGHLMGVALAFPRSVDPRERGRVLVKLLVDNNQLPKKVRLRLGPLGEWVLEKRDSQEPRQTLSPSLWTAFGGEGRGQRGTNTWASVTPVVLDRYPKANRLEPAERHAWEEEVRRIVSDACARIKLPEPELIDIDTTSWHAGVPRAVCKRRPLRDESRRERPTDAALGEGFPPYPPKGTNAPRPQVHVWLRFDRPVIGPVILGAGRYLGYGLCKPLGRYQP